MSNFIELLNVLAWPIVTLFVVIRFRQTIDGLIPSSKLKFTFAGIEIETTPKELAIVIQENYRHGKLTATQWEWLERLKEKKCKYQHSKDYEDLCPLRNCGLIREHPEGYLTDCESVSITPLGEFLLKSKK